MLRDEAGYTQAFVAKTLGISESAVARLEAGTRKLQLVDAIELATLFRVSLDYLIGGQETPRDIFIQTHDFIEVMSRKLQELKAAANLQ